MEICVASALRGGIVEIYADSIGGTLIAEVKVPHTGGWEMWKTCKKKIPAEVGSTLKGIHDVYFSFKGRKGCKLFNFDWWRFEK